MTTSRERTRRYRERRIQGVMAVTAVEVTDKLLRAMIAEGPLEGKVENGETRITRADLAEALNDLLIAWARQVINE